MPIIGIGRLLRRYRPIIVYTLGKYKFLLYCVYQATSRTDWMLILRRKTVKHYEGSRLRRVESGLTVDAVSRFTAPQVQLPPSHDVVRVRLTLLRPSSHPGNRRPSICRISARNLHSIDPVHAVYDTHLRRCTSHSMRRADPAKGSARKCDRSKVAGCLGCELGLKELKPHQLYERLLRQSITGRCVWWCENESDTVVSSGDHRSRRWEGWRHWRGEGCAARVVTGQWSTTPRNPSPCHPSRHPAPVHRQCWIIQCELWAFVLFLELFVLIGNRPIVWHRLSADR